MSQANCFLKHQFPRSSAYAPEWILESVSGGANSLWLTEWLTSALELKAGMHVLDLGCGRAASSIFLAREFGVTVWAADLWFSPTENSQRIRDAGLARNVFPIQADARALPFAANFFDAIVSIDAFPYFGTDHHYLNYLARFVRPGGIVAIAQAGFIDEIAGEVPPHLSKWLQAEPSLWSLHSPVWWRQHWEQTGIVDVEIADSLPDGWQHWVEWHRAVAPDNRLEIETVETDAGRHLGYNRLVGRRRPGAGLAEPIVSVPTSYLRMPLLRGGS